MALTTLGILAVAGVAILLLVFWVFGSWLKKVPPNQALITYGRGGMSVVTGGASWVWPIIQRSAAFSLELMSFDVAPEQDLYSHQGVAVHVEAVIQLKMKSDQESIITAAGQVLSKTWGERQELIRLAMEGHLRGVVGQLTIEQLAKEAEMVSEKMRQMSSSDMTKMGLEMVSFTVKAVCDKQDFIHNMGRPEIERIQKEASIAAALAARDTHIQQARTMSEAAVATAEADQKRVEAETRSMALQAEFQRNLALKKAAFDAQVNYAQAKADTSYDVQAKVMHQQIITEVVKVQELEKTAQVKVQEVEILRRELELQATVLKTAEYERKCIETFAEAERQRITMEARGRADAMRVAGEAEAAANKVRGLVEAEVRQAQGLAEAEVIRAQGEAEGEVMQAKAAAYHEYNQAAIIDTLLTSLPEMVRAVAAPLSKVDSVTVISTGETNDTGMGVSRLTSDIVNIVIQAPALFEALTGLKVADLMNRVPRGNLGAPHGISARGAHKVTVGVGVRDEDNSE